ncbi:anti-sigma factor [Bacillus sp. ISL-40]|uniref:anti-sigma factor family protein n=1 Tax=unclassified Bacillus (in: firmicutes) TaxID=185979 RepID=UPI001BE68FA9|nr:MULTISPECIES: anti-sigma factor [unclassified Bacillus (in: firmicutes)]MBT2699743.1 anti-sigma factor [Bacillus sp. ISL-40]MBT2722244.1 anti-sigma factor [Bacillus sp. ISL-46]MBT2740663.1 anti-sigma factor [Bacillus sp. ISL-77]
MCPEQIIELMHEYLDEEITPDQERILREHLQNCKECEAIFNELNKTIAFVKSVSHMQVPDDFTANVLSRLPKEKRKIWMQRWLKNHPLLAAASLFLILMMGSVFSTWNQDREFSVSKQKNLVVKNNTVIVPKGETVKGDVIVRNGTLEIEGEVQGDVTVINGEKYLASAGHVTGQIEEVNEVFDWIWYHIKRTAQDVVQILEDQPETK